MGREEVLLLLDNLKNIACDQLNLCNQDQEIYTEVEVCHRLIKHYIMEQSTNDEDD